jgi:hypothetical protein
MKNRILVTAASLCLIASVCTVPAATAQNQPRSLLHRAFVGQSVKYEINLEEARRRHVPSGDHRRPAEQPQVADEGADRSVRVRALSGSRQPR